MAQDPDSTLADALGELADELLRAGRSVGELVMHLARWADGAAPDPDAYDADLLRRLLCDTLQPALLGHGVADLLDAAGVLGCAASAIDRDLLLMELAGVGP